MPTSGKAYKLGPNPAVLLVRPRGWHLMEEHVNVDGEADVRRSLRLRHVLSSTTPRPPCPQGSGPYFYLPKMESHLEARLWNDIFVHAQEKLGLKTGTIKATVLIETLPAAFEMDEILFELKDHIVGLNCGRWDYIFSFIKKLGEERQLHPAGPLAGHDGQGLPQRLFAPADQDLPPPRRLRDGRHGCPDPDQEQPRGQCRRLRQGEGDKEREAGNGHDGTWVAHPDLVPVAMEVFNRLMPQANQLDRKLDDVSVTAKDLLEIHQGTRTEEGFRENIRVGVQYMEAWLRGRGAVPIYNMMEDAATAEISRAQIWQFVNYGR